MSKKSTRSWQVILGAATFLASFAVAVSLLPGCSGGTKKKASDTAAAEKEATISRCNNLRENALSKVHPENLGRSSTKTNAKLGLNDWFSRCASDRWDEAWGGDFAGLLDEAELSRAKKQRFSEADADYIRTSYLARDYAASLTANLRSDRERVMALFYSLVDDVELIGAKDALAVTPYEVLLFGQGTAKDRAWTFATILRQIRVDSMILQSGEGKDGKWLFGAVVDNQVLLFDMQTGLPIHKGGEVATVFPMDAATVADATKDSELLKVSGAALTTEELKTAEVKLIGDSTTWTQRSLLLQDSMSTSETAVLCDPLQDLDGPGLRSRIVAAAKGAWDVARVGVWSYPGQQSASYASPNEATQKRLRDAMARFEVPHLVVTSRVDGVGKIDFGAAQWLHFKARTMQLDGRNSEVPKTFTSVRLGKLDKTFPVPPESAGERLTLVKVPPAYYIPQRDAIDDAMVWIAALQLRTKSFQAAKDSVFNYLRKNPEGRWRSHAQYLLIRACVATDDLNRAAKAADDAIALAPENAGLKILKSRIEGLGGKAPAPEEKKPEEKKPEDTKTDEKKTDEKKTDEKKTEEKKTEGSGS